MSPTITIGLPCYNAAAFLHPALASILGQTCTDWELIAVDDGSTDDTGAILRAISDPRVRVIADGQNRGRCARLNQIADLAQGEFLARMDADDVMAPTRLEQQIAFLEAHPAITLLGTAIVSIDAGNRVRGVRCPPLRVESPFRILAGEVLYHPTVMGRTAWFRAHRYRPEYVYSDDFALWAEQAAGLRLANLPEPLLFYREHHLFTYAKYRGRARKTRQALQRFGPAAIGSAKTRALLLRRRLKDAVYTLLQAAGLWRLAGGLANRAIDPATQARYQAILDQI